MTMHNPAHPGEILKALILEALDLNITEAAEHLDISRKTLSKVVNGNGAITPEMALRLEMAFNKPTADHWLRLQSAHDLWQTRQNKRVLNVQPVHVNYA
jgi:addiction module HigA family antidote